MPKMINKLSDCQKTSLECVVKTMRLVKVGTVIVLFVGKLVIEPLMFVVHFFTKHIIISIPCPCGLCEKNFEMNLSLSIHIRNN